MTSFARVRRVAVFFPAEKQCPRAAISTLKLNVHLWMDIALLKFVETIDRQHTQTLMTLLPRLLLNYTTSINVHKEWLFTLFAF